MKYKWIALAILGFGFAYFELKKMRPKEFKPQKLEINKVEGIAPTEAPITSGAGKLEQKINAKFQSVIQKCFPKLSDRKNLTLNDVLHSNSEIDSSKLDFETEKENVHLKSQNGVEYRLHLGPSEKNSKYPFQVKKYAVGKDGLPTPEELSDEEKGQDPKFVFQKYTSNGQVTFRQIALMYHSKDFKNSGRVMLENGRIKSIQFSNGNKFLVCEENSKTNETECQCDLKR